MKIEFKSFGYLSKAEADAGENPMWITVGDDDEYYYQISLFPAIDPFIEKYVPEATNEQKETLRKMLAEALVESRFRPQEFKSILGKHINPNADFSLVNSIQYGLAYLPHRAVYRQQLSRYIEQFKDKSKEEILSALEQDHQILVDSYRKFQEKYPSE